MLELYTKHLYNDKVKAIVVAERSARAEVVCEGGVPALVILSVKNP